MSQSDFVPNFFFLCQIYERELQTSKSSTTNKCKASEDDHNVRLDLLCSEECFAFKESQFPLRFLIALAVVP